MSTQIYPGVNIQYPISRRILNGEKTIETRTYPLPKHYVGVDVLLVETPGKSAKFKARAVAVIKFSESFKYTSRADFYKDTNRHCVDPNSPWAWNAKGKWGWPVSVVRSFQKAIPIGKKTGIKFTKEINLERYS